MSISLIIASLDSEIARLQQARAALSDIPTAVKRGRPSGKPTLVKPVKRNLTPEGRERIRQAVLKRWAKEKKAKKVA